MQGCKRHENRDKRTGEERGKGGQGNEGQIRAKRVGGRVWRAYGQRDCNAVKGPLARRGRGPKKPRPHRDSPPHMPRPSLYWLPTAQFPASRAPWPSSEEAQPRERPDSHIRPGTPKGALIARAVAQPANVRKWGVSVTRPPSPSNSPTECWEETEWGRHPAI